MSEPASPAADPGRTPGDPAVVRAAQLVRTGAVYTLARTRFRGMPGSPNHPRFQVLSYRTPHGVALTGEQPWPRNDVGYSYISELLLATSHSGAHIDALAHVTLPSEDGGHRWKTGSTRDDLGDFGPQRGDASELPPIWRRGVLFDVAGHRGVDCLGRGEAVTAEELQAIGAAQGVELEPGDVALIRTGVMQHWPDEEALLATYRGPGPDLSAARWLVECGVFATGSDTYAYECQPAPETEGPVHPMPVHSFLLIECGVFIMEHLDLEQLARDRVYEFLFVALPLKINGATASMIDPVAVA